jgi:hypothetical protein
MPVAKRIRSCPEGKELKPSTGRCVKKCKPNRVREPATFKCIKNPKNHVVNPITGRQVKRGYYHGIEKAQARILQAIVRRKITKGKPSSGTPEQYKRMSPAARSSMSSASQASRSSSSSSASASPKSNSSSLLGSASATSRSTRVSLSSSSHSSHSSHSSRSPTAAAAATAAAAYSVSSPKHIMKFMDGRRKGEIVKMKKQH